MLQKIASNVSRNFEIAWAYQPQTSLIGIQLAIAKSKIRREFFISDCEVCGEYTRFCSRVHTRTDWRTVERTYDNLLLESGPSPASLKTTSDMGKWWWQTKIIMRGAFPWQHYEVPLRGWTSAADCNILIEGLRGCNLVQRTRRRRHSWGGALLLMPAPLTTRSHTPTDGRRPNNNYAAGAHHAAPGQPSAAHAISTIKWERYWSKFNRKGLSHLRKWSKLKDLELCLEC